MIFVPYDILVEKKLKTLKEILFFLNEGRYGQERAHDVGLILLITTHRFSPVGNNYSIWKIFFDNFSSLIFPRLKFILWLLQLSDGKKESSLRKEGAAYWLIII